MKRQIQEDDLQQQCHSDDNAFRKSSFSISGNCVEVAFHKSSFSKWDNRVEVAFQKSSFSQDTNCVEVAGCNCGKVMVRDSKNPAKLILSFNRSEWAAFIDGVKKNEFDLS